MNWGGSDLREQLIRAVREGGYFLFECADGPWLQVEKGQLDIRLLRDVQHGENLGPADSHLGNSKLGVLPEANEHPRYLHFLREAIE